MDPDQTRQNTRRKKIAFLHADAKISLHNFCSLIIALDIKFNQ